MKDFGEILMALGIIVHRDITKGVTFISQQQYIKTFSTSLDFSMPTEYKQMIGKAMYTMVATRPDIALALGKLARYQDSPQAHHVTAARTLLRYLSSTKDLGIVYHRTGKLQLTG